MVTVSLSVKEIELLKKSIQHCLETCNKGETHEACSDCEALGDVLKKLS